MRKRRLVGVLIFAIPALLAAMTIAVAGDSDKNRFNSNRMNSFQEVATLVTTGTGSFTAELDGDVVRYTLTYSGLEGGTVTQAHLHIGRRATNGGISAWLCGGPVLTGPAGTPTCPQPSGSVSGEIRAAQIVGPAGQGVAAMEFSDFLAALRAGAVYANVHTTTYGGGEIRGQVNEKGAKQADELDDDDEDDDD
ncbi:MAG TPA: CHRD domain-containing protein [Candidatus Limnocylindria bacterium]|nr:CHRD domain-containing protein [Candidatus Limnocylindria bacterium]